MDQLASERCRHAGVQVVPRGEKGLQRIMGELDLILARAPQETTALDQRCQNGGRFCLQAVASRSEGTSDRRFGVLPRHGRTHVVLDHCPSHLRKDCGLLLVQEPILLRKILDIEVWLLALATFQQHFGECVADTPAGRRQNRRA